jgi:hypothetical protein
MVRALMLAMALGATSLPLSAQRAPTPPAGHDARMSAFRVADPHLRDALHRIDAGSAAWRTALDSVAARGGVIIVAAVRELAGVPEQFARGELAEASPVVAADSSVSTVLVVVNVELLERMYRTAGAPRRDLQDDIARILVHEVYGHAIPYLLAGHVSGVCADPVDTRSTGCSIERENEVRRELRLGVRRGYDLDGLALARYIDWSRL